MNRVFLRRPHPLNHFLDLLLTHSEADKKLQRETAMKIYGMVEDLAFFTTQIVSMKDTLKKRDTLATDKALKKIISTTVDSLESIRKKLIATKGGLAITGEERIREKLSELFAGVVYYLGRPTDLQLERIKGLEKEMNDEKAKAEVLWNKNLPDINVRLSKTSSPSVKVLTKEEFAKMDERK